MIKALHLTYLEHSLILPRYPKSFARSVSSLNDTKLFAEIWHSKQIQYALIMNVTGCKFESFSQLSLVSIEVYPKGFSVATKC